MIGPKTQMGLRRYTETPDGLGGFSQNWQGLRKLKGVLSSISGDEKLSQNRESIIQTHNFYIDYPVGATITERDRFVLGTRKFDIIWVENMGANQNKALKVTLKEIS